jgi:hypothetical protein
LKSPFFCRFIGKNHEITPVPVFTSKNLFFGHVCWFGILHRARPVGTTVHVTHAVRMSEYVAANKTAKQSQNHAQYQSLAKTAPVATATPSHGITVAVASATPARRLAAIRSFSCKVNSIFHLRF